MSWFSLNLLSTRALHDIKLQIVSLLCACHPFLCSLSFLYCVLLLHRCRASLRVVGTDSTNGVIQGVAKEVSIPVLKVDADRLDVGVRQYPTIKLHNKKDSSFVYEGPLTVTNIAYWVMERMNGKTPRFRSIRSPRCLYSKRPANYEQLSAYKGSDLPSC